ncbi:scabin-related ADP-ribosyltransferase [Streptomyces flaveolus]|uniref:scabin-related ADP-ribosyltransferase n=1 Tax=Streptomyces flaveolus TaxID=67297 RepID=UPI003F4DA565
MNQSGLSLVEESADTVGECRSPVAQHFRCRIRLKRRRYQVPTQDFSDIEEYGPYASDGSFDEEESQDLIDATLQSVPGRAVTPTPQRAGGFGRSKYGPRPDAVMVAYTGPAVGATLMYRKDSEAVFRWDTRGPGIIFPRGFEHQNNVAPSSLQYYQNQAQDTALVSFTRDPDPNARPEWAFNEEDGLAYRYLGFPPGGYDFVSTLQTASMPSQDEVAFWKGSRPEYVARVDAFDIGNNLVWTAKSGYASERIIEKLTLFEAAEAALDRSEVGEPADQSSQQGFDGYAFNKFATPAMETLPPQNANQSPGYQVQFAQRGPVQSGQTPHTAGQARRRSGGR